MGGALQTDAKGTRLAFDAPFLRTPLTRPYSSAYGADKVAARYCGFREPPAPSRGLWMHGWYPEYAPLKDPDSLFGVSMAHLKSERYWVATSRQAAFLVGRGYVGARAIGLPLVYVPESPIQREKDSLLVMPPHSLPTSVHSWNASEYVETIVALRKQFRRIQICVRDHCWNNGYWVPEFQDAGFEVIRGASEDDDATYDRMAKLFRQFEFVTTNGTGSLLAYASAMGAKVSIHGPFADYTAESMKYDPFYVDMMDDPSHVDNQHFIEDEVRIAGESHTRANLPWFFCHPREAVENIEWGRSELGWQNRVSPEELRDLFGWTIVGRTKARYDSLARRAIAGTPHRIRAKLKAAVSPRFRSERRERCRLEAMGSNIPGRTALFGRIFEFMDAQGYLRSYDECFEKQLFRFRITSSNPFIVDARADVGLSVIYFKCLYPDCRVVALEADPAIFAILERNCRAYELTDVQLVCASLWEGKEACPSTRTVLSDSSENAWETILDSAQGFVLGAVLNQPVDLLKVSLEGADVARMQEVAPLLKNVANIAIDYRSRIGDAQNLHLLAGLLHDADFRILAQTPDAIERQPLFVRLGDNRFDTHIRFMGYRE